MSNSSTAVKSHSATVAKGDQWAADYLNADIPFFSGDSDSKNQAKGEKII